MAANNITMPMPMPIPVVNPNTPMAFIPPSLATRITIETYAAVGSLSVLLWDIIFYIPQDYSLARRFKINFSFIIYCAARVCCLAYLLGVVIITTAPVDNCRLAQQISVLSPFTTPLSVLPFVIRVCALYGNNRHIFAFFSVAWLFVLGCYIMAPIETMGLQSGPTKYCSIIRSELSNMLTSSSVCFFDSAVFVATSWAFMRNSYSDVNVKNSIKVMFFGRYLPAFSKSLLRDGQVYYLATLILNLLVCVISLAPNGPISPCAIAFPFFVMLNNMSSYVYRHLRLGIQEDYSITSSVINRALQEPGQSPHHYRKSFVHQTSMKFEVQGDLEAGDSTMPRTILLTQGTQRDRAEDRS